jgi:hypothetical protein
MRTLMLLALAVTLCAACAHEPASEAATPVRPDAEQVRRAWGAREAAEGRDRVGPKAEFEALFERADWATFDIHTDRALLKAGLWRTGWRALDRGDGDLALKSWEDYARLNPRHGAIRQILHRRIPRALALAGRLPEARRRLAAENLDGAEAADRAQALVLLGDLRLLGGDLDGARTAWKGAAQVPFDDNPQGPVEDARRMAAARLGFVGKRAPPFTAVAALGGEASTRTDLQDRIIVVQPFSVGCRSCRGQWPKLQAMRDRYACEGVLVVGLTLAESKGFLPEPGTPEPFWVGREVVGIKRNEFIPHLEEIRKRIGVQYPWLVQKIGPQMAWNLYAQHAILVVGRDGRIVFADVGGVDLSMVHCVVRRLLAED